MGIGRKLVMRCIHFYKKIDTVITQKNYPMLNNRLRKAAMEDGCLGVVFMLHRVADYEKGRIKNNEDLKISPQLLQQVIDKYRKGGFAFVSLDDVYEILNRTKVMDKPFVAFTMDDGYLDNYKNAYPVFKRNEVPFCIFVASDFIDKKAILWWYSIEELILSHHSVFISDGTVYSCRTYQEKWDTFRYLRERILKLDQNMLLISLNQMFSSYDIDWYAPVRSLAMSWNEIEELSKDRLCTIGGHTMSHPSFIPLSLEAIKGEIEGGNAILESHIHRRICHFAYPYGSLKEDGPREYEFLKSFGFKTVFCSFGGCVKVCHREKMTNLPRYMLKK